MVVDTDVLRSFLLEVVVWLESGDPQDCQNHERLAELRRFQERARAFDVQCEGSPLSMAWFNAVQKQYPAAWPN